MRLNLDRAKVDRVVGGHASDASLRAAAITRSRIQQNINALGRVDTGQMRDTLLLEALPLSGRKARWRIRSPKFYTMWQERGTQAHGPVRASRLVFRIRGRGPLIFAKWVRGITPGLFFSRAMAALRPSDFRQ